MTIEAGIAAIKRGAAAAAQAIFRGILAADPAHALHGRRRPEEARAAALWA